MKVVACNALKYLPSPLPSLSNACKRILPREEQCSEKLMMKTHASSHIKL